MSEGSSWIPFKAATTKDERNKLKMRLRSFSFAQLTSQMARMSLKVTFSKCEGIAKENCLWKH